MVKVLLFLSRFTFICNIAFLFFIFFSWLERRNPVTPSGDGLLQVPFFKNVIITLGFSAIFINLFMNLGYLFCMLTGRPMQAPRWIIMANFLFLLLQLIYFFT